MLKNLFLCLMSGSLLFAAVVNGLRGETANCVVGAVYGSVLAYVLWLTWHEPRADMAFKRWMRWNEAALRGNGAFYRGSLLRVDTELVAYPLCVSYVAGVTRVWSPYYVRHSEAFAPSDLHADCLHRLDVDLWLVVAAGADSDDPHAG